jgi:hypothetical protein
MSGEANAQVLAEAAYGFLRAPLARGVFDLPGLMYLMRSSFTESGDGRFLDIVHTSLASASSSALS